MNIGTKTRLWRIEEIASLLAQGWAEPAVIAALAPPSVARLQQAVVELTAAASSNWLIFTPAWMADAIEADEFPGVRPGLPPDETDDHEDRPVTLAGAANHDMLDLYQPLNRLVHGIESDLPTRVRTIDQLARQRAHCDVLVLGSGHHVTELLASARGLIFDHCPIVILDLAELTGDTLSSVADIFDKVQTLLPGYVAFPFTDGPQPREAPTGRFLVLAKSVPAAELAISRPGASIETAYDATAILLFANGRREPSKGRIRWTGRSPGLIFMIEWPTTSRRIELSLAGALPHGMRLIIDGKPHIFIRDDEGSANETDAVAPFRITAELQNMLPGDRLIKILLAPLRPSTTMRPSPLELRNIRLR